MAPLFQARLRSAMDSMINLSNGPCAKAASSCLFSPLILLAGLSCRLTYGKDSQQLYLDALLDFERYAETIWHPASYAGAPPHAGYLSFNPTARLAPRYAVWFPGRNAATTSLLASQISWATNGNTVVLSFPGPAGTLQVISEDLASGNGTWTADSDGNAIGR